MYAPIFPSWYIKKEMWHRVNPHSPTHPVCNRRSVLDHARTAPDLPKGVAYCVNCLAREPYQPNAETVEALKEADTAMPEATFDNVDDMLAWLNDDAAARRA